MYQFFQSALFIYIFVFCTILCVLCFVQDISTMCFSSLFRYYTLSHSFSFRLSHFMSQTSHLYCSSYHFMQGVLLLVQCMLPVPSMTDHQQHDSHSTILCMYIVARYIFVLTKSIFIGTDHVHVCSYKCMRKCWCSNTSCDPKFVERLL